MKASLFDAHSVESLNPQSKLIRFGYLTKSFMLGLATSCPKLQTVNLYREKVDPQLTLPGLVRFAQHLPCLQHLSKGFAVGCLTAEFSATPNNVKHLFLGGSKVSKEQKKIVAAYLSRHFARLEPQHADDVCLQDQAMSTYAS